MVALRKTVFVSVSNDVLPNNRVSVKKELFDSNILQSVLFKVLRRVCLKSGYVCLVKQRVKQQTIIPGLNIAFIFLVVGCKTLSTETVT